jgi:hypothetical protein
VSDAKTEAQALGCFALVMLLAFAPIIGWRVGGAALESATFNRLTGAHTTWWDAMWVRLTVAESTKPPVEKP